MPDAMRPIIFLDFDGVLNSLRSRVATGHGAHQCHDTIAVQLVQRLAANADAHVVISSAWRVGVEVEMLQGTLRAWGGPALAERVIGKTPDFFTRPRGEEIARWLADNGRSDQADYVILDDEDGMLDGQRSRVVRCAFRDGFGLPEYLQAMRIIAPAHPDCERWGSYLEERARTLEWEA